MGEINDYRDLRVWQRAMDLIIEMYRWTSDMPPEERFGLTSQIRRATVSVASNIAEGYGRGTRPDYIRCLRLARGSLCEVDTQAQAITRLRMLSADTTVNDYTVDCRRMLQALITSLEHD